MWKTIAAAVNRLVMKSYEEAATDKPAGSAPVVAQGIGRDYLEEQFQRAMQLVQGGNAPVARQTIRTAVERVAAQQPGSPIYADARYKEATVLSATGDLTLAETACRQAVDVPAADEATRKERLNYLTYLGGILARENKLDEAEHILRDGLIEREAIFGREHTGYAGGLSALADVLMARARPAEALLAIDEAVRILARAKHERWPADLALRAFILKAAEGLEAPALSAWPELTRGMQKTLAAQCVRQARQATPALAQAVLAELRERLRAVPDMEAPLLLSVEIALVSAAQQNGDHAMRIEACRRMVGLCEPLPERNQLALAQQALAMALDDAGRAAEVPGAYDAAVRTAREVGDLALLSNILRHYALWADRSGNFPLADALHRDAVDNGSSSGDWSTHGRSTVAYGIFLQHAGRVEEARGLLEEAVAHLPPSHADFAAAQEHLSAQDRGEKCSCVLTGPG